VARADALAAEPDNRPTQCRYHCRRCASHFTSLEAFDAHHEGSGGMFNPCAFPNDAELVELHGVCTIGDPTAPAIGTVYSTARAARAPEFFRRPEGHQRARARRSEAVAP
jgi:hypothetical protein